MKNEIVKVDPKEFGLEEKQVATIEKAFAPKIAEREGFAKVYKQLLTKEIDKSVCAEARDLRLKLVKVRTGIADIHRTQKAFFLAAGKFVDAWKNKETEPVSQMEGNLVDIEKYYENQEAERIAKLADARESEIRKYSEVIPYDLGNMDQTVYDNYLTGVRVAMESRIAAEKAAEEERIRLSQIEKLNTERKNKTIRLVEFIDNYENLSFGEMSENDFMALVNTAIKKRTKHEAEQEAIRKENERLKKEAEAAEKKAKAEQEKRDKAEKERIAKEQKEKEAANKAAEKQAAENAKLQAELQAKKDAEIAAQKAKEAAEKREREEAEKLAKAPRKEKLTKWVDSFTLPSFTDDDVAAEIQGKFVAFKKWAKGIVEKV